MSEAEDKPATPEETIAHMQGIIKRLRTALSEKALQTERYALLRGLEVIIMSPEGPVYLKDEELDKYVDNLRLPPDIGVYAQSISQAVAS